MKKHFLKLKYIVDFHILPEAIKAQLIQQMYNYLTTENPYDLSNACKLTHILSPQKQVQALEALGLAAGEVTEKAKCRLKGHILLKNSEFAAVALLVFLGFLCKLTDGYCRAHDIYDPFL
jgi:hypothetical protein